MKSFLFHSVTKIAAWHILAFQGISTFLSSIVGFFSYNILRAIDSKKLQMYEHILAAQPSKESEMQRLELSLLASAQQVRDHAQTNDDWTEGHTDAINAIGDALIGEAGWEEDDVHVYLKDVVESIDGLQYGD